MRQEVFLIGRKLFYSRGLGRASPSAIRYGMSCYLKRGRFLLMMALTLSGIPDGGDPLVQAEEIVRCFEVRGITSDFHGYINTRFGPQDGQSLDLQSTLLSLPFSGVVTTNYDTCFERAIHKLYPHRWHVSPCLNVRASPGHVRVFFNSLRERDLGLMVAHLHGVYDRADDIVLTRGQFIRAYGG